MKFLNVKSLLFALVSACMFVGSLAQALTMTIADKSIDTPKVREYIETLVQQKEYILKAYPFEKWQVTETDYDILAHMAVGILGRESQFFTSKKYLLKENAQWAVNLAKAGRSLISDKSYSPDNSRGGTQIKNISDNIKRAYGVTEDDLNIPKVTAVATMGFLIESLYYLQNKASNRGYEPFRHIDYVNYLPYIYFGRAKAVFDGTATPDTNLYIKGMKLDMHRVNVQNDSGFSAL